jgi:hypothetical protein
MRGVFKDDTSGLTTTCRTAFAGAVAGVRKMAKYGISLFWGGGFMR